MLMLERRTSTKWLGDLGLAQIGLILLPMKWNCIFHSKDSKHLKVELRNVTLELLNVSKLSKCHRTMLLPLTCKHAELASGSKWSFPVDLLQV